VTWALAVFALALAGEPGSADLRYLMNSGWVVETGRHALIFDFVPAIAGAQQLPAEAAPDPATFGGRRVVVFVSHGHADHFSPEVLAWAGRTPPATIVLGFAPDGGTASKVLRPRETWSDGGLEVTTTGSTDEGVGFLVRVDGLTVFHAGDLARWDDEVSAAFAAEIEWLAARSGTIDLAFFPIATGRSCEARPAIREGVALAAARLRPRVLVPMHVRCAGEGSAYEAFRAELQPAIKDVPIVAPSAMGQRLRYRSGRLVPAP
jgi:L-ascorbate metabolism protein UlaG (beta-lactamase superfamily)